MLVKVFWCCVLNLDRHMDNFFHRVRFMNMYRHFDWYFNFFLYFDRVWFFNFVRYFNLLVDWIRLRDFNFNWVRLVYMNLQN